MTTLTEYRVGDEAGEAGAERQPRPGKMSLPNILIYRNDLVERSETFVVNQAEALRKYRGVYCGLAQKEGSVLPVAAPRVLLAGRDRMLNYFRKTAFLYAGICTGWEQRCRALEPVLMHAHFGVDGAFALPLQRALKIPMVVTLHGYDVTMNDAAMRATHGGRLYLRRRQELWERAEVFVCVSEFIRNKAMERGFPKKNLWVHSIGIDLERFRSASDCERDPIVLFVGRLVEKKGCADLIRAMEIVGRSSPDALLVVIGDGPLRGELARLAAEILPGRHEFLGPQSPEVVHAWLERAKVFCVPSVTAANGDAEGLGMVFCEAQAMGVPVVSTMSGGIPEAVVDGITGYLVPEHDVARMANRICLLLSSKDRWREMSLRGREHVAGAFDLEVQTRILEEKYGEVIMNASGR